MHRCVRCRGTRGFEGCSPGDQATCRDCGQQQFVGEHSERDATLPPAIEAVCMRTGRSPTTLAIVVVAVAVGLWLGVRGLVHIFRASVAIAEVAPESERPDAQEGVVIVDVRPPAQVRQLSQVTRAVGGITELGYAAAAFGVAWFAWQRGSASIAPAAVPASRPMGEETEKSSREDAKSRRKCE